MSVRRVEIGRRKSRIVLLTTVLTVPGRILYLNH